MEIMSGRVCVKIDSNAYAGRNKTKILTAELASFYFLFFYPGQERPTFSLFQFCVTPTETFRLIRNSHLDFHADPELCRWL